MREGKNVAGGEERVLPGHGIHPTPGMRCSCAGMG